MTHDEGLNIHCFEVRIKRAGESLGGLTSDAVCGESNRQQHKGGKERKCFCTRGNPRASAFGIAVGLGVVNKARKTRSREGDSGA